MIFRILKNINICWIVMVLYLIVNYNKCWWERIQFKFFNPEILPTGLPFVLNDLLRPLPLIKNFWHAILKLPLGNGGCCRNGRSVKVFLPLWTNSFVKISISKLGFQCIRPLDLPSNGRNKLKIFIGRKSHFPRWELWSSGSRSLIQGGETITGD